MLDTILSFMAPHRCYSCLVVGASLCKSCIYNITCETISSCFYCGAPSMNGVCPTCRTQSPFSHFYLVGERRDELKRLLDDFKFNRALGLHRALTVLLDITLPALPPGTIVVSLPTISRHRRIRGYDQTEVIAKQLARRRGLRQRSVLKRKTNTIQRGASASVRQEQAKRAYRCDTSLDPTLPYLLIDDIVTTGASMKAAATCLQQAGATTIIAAAVARQT